MKWKSEITVRCIAQSVPISGEIEAWVNEDLGADGWEMPAGVHSGDAICGVAAKRCYNSFQPGLNPNVTKVRSDWVEFIDNILKSGHGSVLEHASWTFTIEGCTRVFTAEMNRHRAGVAISEASMRYIRFDEITMWLPRSLMVADDDTPELAEKKKRTVACFERVMGTVEEMYKSLCKDVWQLHLEMNFDLKKKITSMLRRVLPLGLCTGAVYTLNARALRHILALRSSPHAEEEIAFVMSKIGALMFDEIFHDFKLVNGYWVPEYRKI